MYPFSTCQLRPRPASSQLVPAVNVRNTASFSFGPPPIQLLRSWISPLRPQHRGTRSHYKSLPSPSRASRSVSRLPHTPCPRTRLLLSSVILCTIASLKGSPSLPLSISIVDQSPRPGQIAQRIRATHPPHITLPFVPLLPQHRRRRSFRLPLRLPAFPTPNPIRTPPLEIHQQLFHPRPHLDAQRQTEEPHRRSSQ